MTDIVLKMSKNLFLVVDIGGTHTRCGLVDHEGTVFFFHRVLSKDLFSRSVEDFLNFLEQYLKQVNISKANLNAVVVGVPCTIDRDRMQILSCPNLRALEGKDFKVLVTEKFEVPVFIEKDTNLSILGEHWKGAAKGFRTVIGIFVGTGLGCGLIVDNKLFIGSHGVAAELGHIVVPGKYDQCPCGNQGCVELYTGGTAVAKAIEHCSARHFGMDERLVAPKNEELKEIKELLAWVIGTVVNILDPDLVVIGGGVINAGWFDVIDLSCRALKYTRKPEPAKSLVVKCAILGDKAALVGGAKYAMEYLRLI